MRAPTWPVCDPRRWTPHYDRTVLASQRHAHLDRRETPCGRPILTRRQPSRRPSRRSRTSSATPRPCDQPKTSPTPGSSPTAESRSSSPASTPYGARTSENAAGRPRHRRRITDHQAAPARRAAARDRRPDANGRQLRGRPQRDYEKHGSRADLGRYELPFTSIVREADMTVAHKDFSRRVDEREAINISGSVQR